MKGHPERSEGYSVERKSAVCWSAPDPPARLKMRPGLQDDLNKYFKLSHYPIFPRLAP